MLSIDHGSENKLHLPEGKSTAVFRYSVKVHAKYIQISWIYLSIDLSIYLSNIQPKYGVSMHVWFFHSPECRVIGVCCIRQAHLNITCRLISWSRDDSHGRLAFWVSVLLCTPFSINITIHLPKLFRSISTCCTWYMPSRLSCKNMHISSHLRNIAGSATRFVAHSLLCSLALSLSPSLHRQTRSASVSPFCWYTTFFHPFSLHMEP